MSYYFDVSTEYDFGPCALLALADEEEDYAPGRGGDAGRLLHGQGAPAGGHMFLDGTDYGPCALALAAEESEEDDFRLPTKRGGYPGRRGALALVADYFEDREALAPHLQDAAVPWAHRDFPTGGAGSQGSRRSTWPRAPPCRGLLPAEGPLPEEPLRLERSCLHPQEDASTPSTASFPTPGSRARPPCLGAWPAEEVSTPSTASHPRNPWLGFDNDRDSCDSSSKASRGSWSPGSCGYPTLPRQQWPGWPNSCVPQVPSLRDWEVPPSGRCGAPGAGHEKVDEWGRPGSPVHGPLGLEHFDLVQTVGTGFLGRVSVVKMRRPHGASPPLVLKVMEKSTVLAKKQVQHVLNERQILSSIRHPFCVSLVASFQDDTRLFLLMDYISGGELFSYTRVTQGLQSCVARFFASEVALALQYLHELDIVYRDLKPENVLLDSEGHVKITDFGFAKVITGPTYTICGTAVYMAPEIIARAGHGKAADWWAFGVFVFELLTGTTPFVGRPADVYRQACHDEVQFPSRMPDDERDLIGRLMTREPSRRLGSSGRLGGASEVKAHPWFRTLDWDRVIQKRYQPPLVPSSRCLDYVCPSSEFDGGMTGCFDDGLMAGCFNDGGMDGCFDGGEHGVEQAGGGLTDEQQALFDNYGSCFGAY
mmetsp:Transcript_27475/g.78400  ORF Transcript_27475/g.78400 Transcript_27475/m.78400 type:complete len:650 (-) Transcript_27475:172-2121(-)